MDSYQISNRKGTIYDTIEENVSKKKEESE